jgi:cytochrome c oxidase cbb3-type subunit 2
MIAAAMTDVRAQVDPDADGVDALLERYPGAQVRNFDGRADITELDALIAYLQVLGTMVDFSTYEIEVSR